MGPTCQGGETQLCLGQGCSTADSHFSCISPNTTAVALLAHTISEPRHSLVTVAYPRGCLARHHQELMADSKQSLLSTEGTCFSH